MLIYPKPAGFTYFITSAGNSAIKIGWTVDPARRLAALQIGNGSILRVLGMIDKPVEERWHYRFKAARLHGEWFRRTPELLAAIAAERTHILKRHKRDGRTTRLERIVAVERLTAKDLAA